MKLNLWMILVITALMVIPAGIPSANALPVASLELLQTTPIELNDMFDVGVFLNDEGSGEHLLSFGFDVLTDSGDCFIFESYMLNSAFDDDVIMGFNPHDVGASAFPEVPLISPLHIATLTFSTIAPGTDTLSIQGLDDGMFAGLWTDSEIYDIVASLDVTVHEPSHPVPEPGTLLLLASGLFGLFGIKKRPIKKA